MKSTTALRMLCTPWLAENSLNIHPNEGSDLGLMMAHYSVEIGDGAKAELFLRNDCPRESVEIGRKFWERLGKPDRAILSYDGAILRIDRAH